MEFVQNESEIKVIDSDTELEFPYEQTVHLKNCEFRKEDVNNLKEYMKKEDFEFDFNWLTDDVLMLLYIKHVKK